MSNPAQQLAELLDSWGLSNNHPVAARGGEGEGNLEFWQGQSDAVVLLQDVQRVVDSLRASGRDMRAFDAAVPSWYRAVFSHGQPWNQGVSGFAEAIGRTDLDQLRSLALIIDFVQGAPALSVAQRTTVGELLDETLNLLRGELVGVPGAESGYVRLLVSALRAALANEATDPSVLKARIDQLTGALVGISATLNEAGDPETARSLGSIVGRIIAATRTVVYDDAAVATLLAAAPAIQKMIEDATK